MGESVESGNKGYGENCEKKDNGEMVKCVKWVI